MGGLKNTLIATIYSTASSVGSQLLLVPIFLHYWGAEKYGNWLVLYAIPACFTFLDAGISNSLGNALTIAFRQQRLKDAQQMLAAVEKYQRLGIYLAITLFGIAVAILPMRRWLRLESLDSAEFSIASIVLCLYTAQSLQLGIYAAILRAANCFDRFVRWTAHARWAEVLACSFALAYGLHVIGVALAIFLIRSLLVAVCWKYTQKALPDLRKSKNDGTWREFTKLLSTGLAFMTLPVGQGVINQGCAILLNNQIGPVAVVTLSVSRQLARLYLNLITALSSALHPEMTGAYANNDLMRIQTLYAVGLASVLWTALPAIILLSTIGPSLAELWTNSATEVTSTLMLACSVEVVTSALGLNAALPAYASNRHVSLCLSYILCIFGALLIAALLISNLGVSIIPFSFSVTALVFVVQGTRTSIDLLQTKPARIFYEIAEIPKKLLRNLKA